MKKEELISEDFLKQFKTGEELTSFLKLLQKRGIEKMLEGELDSYLGYDKNKVSSNTNARNGFSTKKIKTSFGEVRDKDSQRDREFSFNPMIVPVFCLHTL